MSTPDHLASEPPERDSTPGVVPDVAGEPGLGAAGIAALVLIVGAVVALLLVLVVFPIWDGMKARDGAWETYSELHSMSYEAGWKIDSEIRSVQASLDGDLSGLDSGLWSVGFDLGSLAYDVGAESRPRVQELEDAMGARRGELRQLRRSADARFEQLRDSVEARLGGLEEAADAALDDHWDNSSRRFSRDGWIVLGWFGALAAVLLGLSLVGLWMSWRDYRALARPAGGM